MRDDGDFITDLRREIATSQDRRTKYVILKLSFIVGIFGVGSVNFSTVLMTPLIYLTTLVICVYDLYIIGEDYAVKRAGRFILGSPWAPYEEKRWEKTAKANRDPVTGLANVVSSFLVVVAAAIALFPSQHQEPFYTIWIFLSIAVLASLVGYGRSLVRRLKKLDNFLKTDGTDGTEIQPK